MLQKHIFKTITGAAFGDVCLRECYRDVRCQSFNYVFTQDKCELSNRTKEARPEDFIPNSDRYYFRRDMKRGKMIWLIVLEGRISQFFFTFSFSYFLTILGAIPELSADSCKENQGERRWTSGQRNILAEFHQTSHSCVGSL
ncbi:unnamed protein product [Pocillopora meandrina]|uniref:Apple domain-containing protein n=1 Tax=Pocillopora meandrina TaxID=46732 RepID=A0AAU9Y6A4_9CNID|nr:unnamed protein product [Pocillopora meandrina]